MKRAEALRVLSELEPSLMTRFQVTRLGVFGSTARDAASGETDMDIVVEMPALSLWTVAGLREELERKLGVPVDPVRCRDSLNPRLKRRIDAEAVYI